MVDLSTRLGAPTPSQWTFKVGTVAMKVQLVVVQGKPEGKVIPLAGPVFKIGRGETCHLRPNSEQVSREHAEFVLTADTVSVKDLGSRNGTLVNGKAITASFQLKDQDLVQVGPLTFAVSIQGAPAASKPASAAPAAGKGSPEDVASDDIDSWLVGDKNSPAPERPSGVYAGDTITIAAFKDSESPKEGADEEDSDEEYERQGEGDEAEPDAAAETVDEFIDESNPFYVKKKAEPEGPKKPAYKDTSDAASDILRKMMERRRSSR
jgi:predicted component of type VI protein secretion system